jgi:hypothetical protein
MSTTIGSYQKAKNNVPTATVTYSGVTTPR